MTSTQHDGPHAVANGHGASHAPANGHTVTPPDVDDLAAMTQEEQMIMGAAVEGVYIVHRRNRFPIPGTRAERRAERIVSLLFVLAALAGVGFIVAFIALPYRWHLPNTSQTFRFYTPVLGALLGLMLVLIGFGAVLWAKWLMPEEEVLQDRHDTPSTEQDKIMTQATLAVALQDAGLPRRTVLLRSLGLAGGALAAVPLVAMLGALIRKPSDTLDHTPYGLLQPKYPNGVPIIYDDGRRVSPDDMQAGGIATVFPVGYTTDASSPTLLIRIRPGQTIKSRKGQAGYGWGDFVAYSKICTHAGCPASLYEQQTSRLLCPCHQSQFEVLDDAKPVFGPATRSLPKLPLGDEVVAGRQYFVAVKDFQEPIGPGFWERK